MEGSWSNITRHINHLLSFVSFSSVTNVAQFSMEKNMKEENNDF